MVLMNDGKIDGDGASAGTTIDLSARRRRRRSLGLVSILTVM